MIKLRETERVHEWVEEWPNGRRTTSRTRERKSEFGVGESSLRSSRDFPLKPPDGAFSLLEAIAEFALTFVLKLLLDSLGTWP